MRVKNPYALYVNCDGAMDYDSDSSGGIGFIITFPDFIPIDPIKTSIGIYMGGNIERLELEALIQAMRETIDVYRAYGPELRRINKIIFVTDRYGLKEDEKTSPYKIAAWRKNGWRNFEQKPIKNHELLDELDKTRLKLSKEARVTVSIEYRPRKQNRGPDKLAKTGKTTGVPIEKLSKPGEKIGRRKFDGPEIKYVVLKARTQLHVHVFRKDPVQDQWEVWVEIVDGGYKGCKLKIYADDLLSKKLKRRNEFVVKIKSVFTHHVSIYQTLRRIRNTKAQDIPSNVSSTENSNNEYKIG